MVAPSTRTVSRHNSINRNDNHRGGQGGGGIHLRPTSCVSRLFTIVGVALVGYHVMWTYWLAGVNIPDIEVGQDGVRRTRRRPDLLVKHDNAADKDIPTDFLDGILEGYHTLVRIKLPRKGLFANRENAYSGVTATFCHISWHLQERDPTKVPMFKDLKDQSMLCGETIHTVDLHAVVAKARAYDQRNHTFAATSPKSGQGPVPPTAVIFHETRCGSTLMANDFAAFSPKQTRVFSEAPAPVAALRACENRPCDPNAQEQLIRDVFYLMGRVTRPIRPQYAFYKIQSLGVRSIDAFARAMPETPWIFSYRDSVEIMMSHFKNFQVGNPLSQDFMPVCLRTFGEPQQPPDIVELVEKLGRTVESLEKEEYCAAHLASLAEAAIDEHIRTADTTETPHWFVNYSQLPYVLWEHILPKITGNQVTEKQLKNMQEISAYYSKGRGQRAGQHWHEDNTVKHGMAPESIKAAAKLILDPTFEKLETIRTEITAKAGY